MSSHSLDRALALAPVTHAETEAVFSGHYQGLYANMIGPFGGLMAATVLQGVLQHPSRRGDPLSVTVNFASALADAPFEVRSQLARATRSTQHWQVSVMQNGQVALTGTVMLATRQDSSWEATELVMPAVPPVTEVPRLDTDGFFPPWLRHYALHVVAGGIGPQTPPVTGRASESTLWVRDEPPRALDFLSLLALSDVFFPRVFVARQQMMPAGTVTLTTYFHADAEALARQGARELLGVARGNRFHRGFFDQDAELWSHDGELLVTTHQVVYFKG